MLSASVFRCQVDQMHNDASQTGRVN